MTLARFCQTIVCLILTASLLRAGPLTPLRNKLPGRPAPAATATSTVTPSPAADASSSWPEAPPPPPHWPPVEHPKALADTDQADAEPIPTLPAPRPMPPADDAAPTQLHKPEKLDVKPTEKPEPTPPPAAATPPATPTTFAWMAVPEARTCVPPPMLLSFPTYYQPGPATPLTGPPAQPAGALPGSMFPVADNGTVLPVDRVFLNVSNVRNAIRPARADSEPRLNVSREMFGFEKTFLGGDASLELRLPFYQFHDAPGTISDFGDLTLIGKYWLIDHKPSGIKTSVGLALSCPTGRGIIDPTTGSSSSNCIAQPFVGSVWTWGDFYLQSFLSIACSGDNHVSSVCFCNLGAGYCVIRGLPGVRSVTLVAELQKMDAIFASNAEHNPFVSVPSMDSLALGAHFECRVPLLLTIGLTCPLSGFQGYDTQCVIQCNYRF